MERNKYGTVLRGKHLVWTEIGKKKKHKCDSGLYNLGLWCMMQGTTALHMFIMIKFVATETSTASAETRTSRALLLAVYLHVYVLQLGK